MILTVEMDNLCSTVAVRRIGDQSRYGKHPRNEEYI